MTGRGRPPVGPRLEVRLPADEIETLKQAARYRDMTMPAWVRLIVTSQNAADRKAGKLKT